MDFAGSLTRDAKVIDIGAPDDALARHLARRGRQRYLALVSPDGERPGCPELAERFHPLTSPTQIWANNADVIILRDSHLDAAWMAAMAEHPEYLLLDVGSLRAGLRARLAVLPGRVRGRLRPAGLWRAAGTTFLVLRAPGRRRQLARHYASPVWGIAGLARRAEEAGLRYAVLRWFEELPHLDPGEDLDVLVADDDVARFQALLAEEPGTIPVDVYSETGLEGSDFRAIAYYPPDRAHALLERTIGHPSGCRVPSPLDHLHSLAYHALYHKGERSGIPSALLDGVEPDPEHDYAAVLHRLAHVVGVRLGTTMEEIDDHLAHAGWRPPADALRRLAAANSWLDRRLGLPSGAVGETPEPAVLVIRERTLDLLPLEEVTQAMHALGFEILHSQPLDVASAAVCRHQMRGGNWGRGPFAASGGGPAHVIVAVHYGPRRPPPHLRSQYPRLSNRDVLRVKLAIRERVAALLPDEERFNPIHSADDELEAWEYMDLAVPDVSDRLRDEVSARRDAYRTEAPVREVLSLGRRAKVELIDAGDGSAPVVRKTYAPCFRDYLDRELGAMAELRPHLDCVPETLEVGPTWFSLPYYDSRLGEMDRADPRPLPLSAIRDMVRTLRTLHGLGVDLVDAKPQNFLLDRRGLRLVDYEFYHRYAEHGAPAFDGIYSFAGPPPSFEGALPFGELSYEANWRPWTGIPLSVLLEGPVWLQHAHRSWAQITTHTVGPSGALRQSGRSGRRMLVGGRQLAGSRYRSWASARSRLVGV